MSSVRHFCEFLLARGALLTLNSPCPDTGAEQPDWFRRTVNGGITVITLRFDLEEFIRKAKRPRHWEHDELFEHYERSDFWRDGYDDDDDEMW
jgi:hypothetical protein